MSTSCSGELKTEGRLADWQAPFVQNLSHNASVVLEEF